jgi:hypothetical protein
MAKVSIVIVRRGRFRYKWSMAYGTLEPQVSLITYFTKSGALREAKKIARRMHAKPRLTLVHSEVFDTEAEE